MSWQDIVVAAIMVLCVSSVAVGMLRRAHGKDAGGVCAHCAAPCDIKRLYDKKRQSCEAKTKKNGGSCCQ